MSAGPLVSAELADQLQDADTLSVLEVMSLAISRQDLGVVRYCAQVLKARLHEEAARPDPLGEALNSGDGSYRP